jgi:hypothetical protein
MIPEGTVWGGGRGSDKPNREESCLLGVKLHNWHTGRIGRGGCVEKKGGRLERYSIEYRYTTLE